MTKATRRSAETPELVVFAATSLVPGVRGVRAAVRRRPRCSSRSPAPTSSPRRSARASLPTSTRPRTPTLPDELAADDLLEQPHHLRHQRARRRRPGRLRDRRRGRPRAAGDVTIAIGDPEVPVGAYTREVLADLGAGRIGGDPRQRRQQRARRRRDRRQADPGRRRRRVRLSQRRRRLQRRARGDRASRRASAPTSPTGSRSAPRPPQPELAQEFVDVGRRRRGPGDPARLRASGRSPK